MKQAFQAAFLIGWTWGAAWGAEPKVPTGEQFDELDKSAYATEQKARERPIRFEQDCPPPETVDLFQGTGWNTAEIGLSFSLVENAGDPRPYSRYTCPYQGIKAGR